MDRLRLSVTTTEKSVVFLVETTPVNGTGEGSKEEQAARFISETTKHTPRSSCLILLSS